MAVATGRLQLREWTDQNGNKRRNAEVVADHVYFGESKSAQRPADVSAAGFNDLQNVDDGELPF